MHIHQHHQSLKRRGHIVSGNAKLRHPIDIAAYIASFASLVFSTDQARIIWVNHDASGVSLLMWVVSVVAAVIWYFYGVIHKDRIITLVNAIWMVLASFILLGIILYR